MPLSRIPRLASFSIPQRFYQVHLRVLKILVLLFGLCITSLYAAERITLFHSDIDVQADRSLVVTETIEVVAENKTIKHGIYRDFPTRYPHPDLGYIGFRETTGFSLEGITLNGQKTPWHQQRLSNGVRIYIGDSNRYISLGAHQYVLKYTSSRQIGHHGGDDTLLWRFIRQYIVMCI